MTTILLLAANPKDTSPLELYREIYEIDQVVRNAHYGSYFKFEPKVAVKRSDLLMLLEKYKPDIVHFSGHGSPSSAIYLEDENGNSQVVPPEVMKDVFSLSKNKIRCVVFNTCYLENQANAVAEEIAGVVIGMTDEVTDKSATDFAKEFYRKLANGSDILTAFYAGRTQIDDGKKLLRIFGHHDAPEKIRFISNSSEKPNINSFGLRFRNLLVIILFILFIYFFYTFMPPSEGVQIDALYQSLFTVNGQDDSNSQSGTGKIIIERIGTEDLDYKFEYNLPNPEEGYAAFVFGFSPPLDITIYKSLVITLSKDDADVNCQINLKQGNDNTSYITLCDGSFEYGRGVTMIENTDTGLFTVTIPLLQNFQSVNPRNVDEIAFGVDSRITSGKHTFTVHEVLFVE